MLLLYLQNETFSQPLHNTKRDRIPQKNNSLLVYRAYCWVALNACWDTRDSATPLNWIMTATGHALHGQVRLFVDVHQQTVPNLSVFFPKDGKRFNQQWLQFLLAYSFSNWLAVSCFSFRKA